MDQQNCEKIISSYGWKHATANTLTSGLINHTWKVQTDTGDFILQKINTAIFQHPDLIDENIRMMANYLDVFAPDYLFTAPVKNLEGETLVMQGETDAYRAFEFQKNTHTIAVVSHAAEAEEAARQFGSFTHQLSGFNAGRLHITLADFHNLFLRYVQFEQALKENNTERSVQAAATAGALLQKKSIVDQYNAFVVHPDVRLRVTHHDTKISNVLFNEDHKAVCVIDLDTVMPGYLFSDAGDMFRTYLPPVSEEEADLDQLFIRKDILKAIETGYLNTLSSDLSTYEKDHFYLSGDILIYMQAIRFLTDYLQEDRYYGKKYPDQNLVRAKNQLRLLELYQEAI